MSQPYAYIYFDPTRNEPIYVGKGHGLRAYKHLTRKDNHPLTNRLMSTKPDIALIECSDDKTALLLEQGLIRLIGRRKTGTGPLLNLTDGGEGASGCIRSEETKQKMRERKLGRPQTPEHRANLSAALKGKGTGKRGPRPEEVKAKISKSMMGNKNKKNPK